MKSLNKMNNYQTSSGSTYTVYPKLSNSNYFSWSASMVLTLRSLNQWEVIKGLYPSPTCVNSKAPTNEELELEQAWALQKEHAYMEIDLHSDNQQVVGYVAGQSVCYLHLY